MPRAFRTALLVTALLALGLVLREALTSAETRVRRTLDGGVEAFNDGDVFGCVRRLHGAFEHTTPPRLDRALFAQGLIAWFDEHRAAPAGELDTRASRVPDTLAIDIQDDGRAAATFELLLEVRDGADAPWRTRWHADVEATLEREALGWVVREARSDTRAGRPPR